MKEEVEKKAEEKVTLSKAELWLLRVAALTGVASFLSHIGDLISKLFGG